MKIELVGEESRVEEENGEEYGQIADSAPSQKFPQPHMDTWNQVHQESVIVKGFGLGWMVWADEHGSD